MYSKSLITDSFGVGISKSFVQEVRDGVAYYVFVGKHVPYANNSDQIISTPVDSVKDGLIGVYDDMIFGKKVQSTDVTLMINRYDWLSNTVFDMYDDVDSELYAKKFYACVNVGSYSNIYKCLYNNANTASVVEPSGTDNRPFQTPQDGYVWKYMFTIPDDQMTKFATIDHIPVIANTSAQSNATAGAIDIIDIDVIGGGYENYLVSSFGTASDIKVGGNPYLYGLGATASSIDNFYNDCVLKMTSGDAKNEYKIITDYYIANGQKIVVLADIFTNLIKPTDSYEIYPYVYVFDTGGSKNTNCIARAIINTSGNSISYVDILQAGSKYRSATARLNPDPAVPVTTTASLRPIIPPAGGHGYEPESELHAKHASVSVKFVENESPFTTNNDYRSIGLLKEPRFANVVINIDVAKTIGNFAAAESIFQYTPVTLAGIITTANNATLTGNGSFFAQALMVGDMVIVSNGSVNKITSISAISSNTSLTLTDNVGFTSTQCVLTYVKDKKQVGVLFANSAGQITVSNANPIALSKSPYLLGSTSSCTSVINLSIGDSTRITINGRTAEDYSKFNQLISFTGTLGGGPQFINDEIIAQSSVIPDMQPLARFHSIFDANTGPNDQMYVTNTKNVFQTVFSSGSDGVITGQTSGAQFVLNNKYIGDVIPDTGKVLYLENLNPITRANTKTETIKLLLEFN